jgi:hypothetical protein
LVSDVNGILGIYDFDDVVALADGHRGPKTTTNSDSKTTITP